MGSSGDCKVHQREAHLSETINLYETKTHLSQLVERAAAGEEIIIAKAGKPRARLVALPEERPERKPGLLKGKIWIADDFDDPLPEDMQRAFEEW